MCPSSSRGGRGTHACLSYPSESELDTLPPRFASAVRQIRDDFAVRACRGELIRDSIVVERDRNGRVTNVTLVLEQNSWNMGNKMYTYEVTLQSLVYAKIKSGEVTDMSQAVIFGYQEISHNPLFPKEVHNELKKQVLESGLFSDFTEAFAKIANQI